MSKLFEALQNVQADNRPAKVLGSVPVNKKVARRRNVNTTTTPAVANVGYLQDLTRRTAYTAARQSPSAAVTIDTNYDKNDSPYAPVSRAGAKRYAATSAGEQRRFWSWLKTRAAAQ